MIFRYDLAKSIRNIARNATMCKLHFNKQFIYRGFSSHGTITRLVSTASSSIQRHQQNYCAVDGTCYFRDFDEKFIGLLLCLF